MTRPQFNEGMCDIQDAYRALELEVERMTFQWRAVVKMNDTLGEDIRTLRMAEKASKETLSDVIEQRNDLAGKLAELQARFSEDNNEILVLRDLARSNNTTITSLLAQLAGLREVREACKKLEGFL